MTSHRLTLIALAAGVLTAGGLALVNIVAGPQMCVTHPICVLPLPGETGCGPVPSTCSGLLLPVQAVAALSVGASLLVGVLLGVRRRR